METRRARDDAAAGVAAATIARASPSGRIALRQFCIEKRARATSRSRPTSRTSGRSSSTSPSARGSSRARAAAVPVALVPESGLPLGAAGSRRSRSSSTSRAAAGCPRSQFPTTQFLRAARAARDPPPPAARDPAPAPAHARDPSPGARVRAAFAHAAAHGDPRGCGGRDPDRRLREHGRARRSRAAAHPGGRRARGARSSSAGRAGRRDVSWRDVDRARDAAGAERTADRVRLPPVARPGRSRRRSGAHAGARSRRRGERSSGARSRRASSTSSPISSAPTSTREARAQIERGRAAADISRDPARREPRARTTRSSRSTRSLRPGPAEPGHRAARAPREPRGRSLGRVSRIRIRRGDALIGGGDVTLRPDETRWARCRSTGAGTARDPSQVGPRRDRTRTRWPLDDRWFAVLGAPRRLRVLRIAEARGRRAAPALRGARARPGQGRLLRIPRGDGDAGLAPVRPTANARRRRAARGRRLDLRATRRRASASSCARAAGSSWRSGRTPIPATTETGSSRASSTSRPRARSGPRRRDLVRDSRAAPRPRHPGRALGRASDRR